MADDVTAYLERSLAKMRAPEEGLRDLRDITSDASAFAGNRFDSDTIPDEGGGHPGPGYRGRITQRVENNAVVLEATRRVPPLPTRETVEDWAAELGRGFVRK